MSKNQKIIFISLMLLAAFLLFFRLTRQDMLGDDGHYAFRSLGYFDFLSSLKQTTPVQWFGERPWWSYLSFHDHPMLFFLIQNWFFKIFGVSILISRLPSVFAALGSAVLVYLIGKRMAGIEAGLLSMGALVLNNYFIWTGRIGLLESVFTFFLLLGILYLLKALEDSPKFFRHAGFYLGLAFLTKYTFLFVLPGLFLYILWKQRQIFSNKKFWQGVIIFVLAISPIIIYNLMLYVARGHFDVQFSDLFKQQHADWTLLSNRVQPLRWNFGAVVNTLVEGYSIPYFALVVLSFSTLLFFLRKERFLSVKLLPVLVISSMLIIFPVVGGAARWLGVTSPFAALVLGLGFGSWQRTNSYQKLKYLVWALVGIVSVFFVFYIINTNHLRKPVGGQFLYSDFRVENYGYTQLDQKITELLAGKRSPPNVQEAARLWWYKDMKPEAVDFAMLREGSTPFASLLIYDLQTNWFATMWIFERWKQYHRFLIMTSEEFLKVVRSENDLTMFNSLNLDSLYLVVSGKEVARESRVNFPETKILVDNFVNQGITPEIIYDDQGREAFYIYHGQFK